MRDAHGIRPSYYYINDDVIAAASERQPAYRIQPRKDEVKELMPGCALVVKASGEQSIEQIVEPKERKACSFERIYFSRGSDEKIYRERIALVTTSAVRY